MPNEARAFALGSGAKSGMINRTESALHQLRGRLPDRVSMPGDNGYAAATAIWAKPVGRRPRAVIHCQTTQDVQFAIRVARDCDLPVSVRCGGHDWAGRALCEGIVVDLRAMNKVVVNADSRVANIAGGARAADVVAAAEPFGLAPVTGSVGAVGMAGLTLGGGYGPLIGRFGLALDSLVGAEVVLADGSVVGARPDREEELFWALRGGGGNFGVVTAMRHRVHNVPSVHSGILIYPFGEATTVLAGCAEIAARAPDELTAQIGLAAGLGGAPVVMVVPTWCGQPEEGEAQLAPFRRLGTLLADTVEPMSYGAALTLFDSYLAYGQRVFMETCWLPTLDARSIETCIDVFATAISPGCAIFTHEFRGAASRVPEQATAFGLRSDHTLVEILTLFADGPDGVDEFRHQMWARRLRYALAAHALPGGYPNLLVADDPDRVTESYGRNTERLIAVKRKYDPDNLFCSAIPIPSANTSATASSFGASKEGARALRFSA
jgi:FAD/FMN-containing dehydrogenase